MQVCVCLHPSLEGLYDMLQRTIPSLPCYFYETFKCLGHMFLCELPPAQSGQPFLKRKRFSPCANFSQHSLLLHTGNLLTRALFTSNILGPHSIPLFLLISMHQCLHEPDHAPCVARNASNVMQRCRTASCVSVSVENVLALTVDHSL